MHYSKVRYLYSVLHERYNVPARLVTLHISLENRKPFDLWSITHTISMPCLVLCIPLIICKGVLVKECKSSKFKTAYHSIC